MWSGNIQLCLCQLGPGTRYRIHSRHKELWSQNSWAELKFAVSKMTILEQGFQLENDGSAQAVFYLFHTEGGGPGLCLLNNPRLWHFLRKPGSFPCMPQLWKAALPVRRTMVLMGRLGLHGRKIWTARRSMHALLARKTAGPEHCGRLSEVSRGLGGVCLEQSRGGWKEVKEVRKVVGGRRRWPSVFNTQFRDLGLVVLVFGSQKCGPKTKHPCHQRACVLRGNPGDLYIHSNTALGWEQVGKIWSWRVMWWWRHLGMSPFRCLENLHLGFPWPRPWGGESDKSFHQSTDARDRRPPPGFPSGGSNHGDHPRLCTTLRNVCSGRGHPQDLWVFLKPDFMAAAAYLQTLGSRDSAGLPVHHSHTNSQPLLEVPELLGKTFQKFSATATNCWGLPRSTAVTRFSQSLGSQFLNLDTPRASWSLLQMGYDEHCP